MDKKLTDCELRTIIGGGTQTVTPIVVPTEFADKIVDTISGWFKGK